jgi:pimeloyl-ACP methyl ester carboxylesterase
LRDLGHHVEAVDLHRGSLAADTFAAQEVVDRFAGPVVACGWSYGGMVITGLELPAGSHLAYVCAFMPDEGETASSLTEHRSTSFADLLALDGAGDLVVEGDQVDEIMWADASPERAAAGRVSLRSQAIAPLVESSARVAWRELPSTYVVGRQDRVIHPDLQREMAPRATEVIEWDTSHSPMLSRPDLMVELLDRLAA